MELSECDTYILRCMACGQIACPCGEAANAICPTHGRMHVVTAYKWDGVKWSTWYYAACEKCDRVRTIKNPNGDRKTNRKLT